MVGDQAGPDAGSDQGRAGHGAGRGWGALLWRLFTRAKAAGETLTDADIVHAFCLGEEDVLDLVGRGPVGKSLRYLLRQIERAGVEPEDEDPDPNGVIDVSILLDYWRMAELVGRDLRIRPSAGRKICWRPTTVCRPRQHSLKPRRQPSSSASGGSSWPDMPSNGGAADPAGRQPEGAGGGGDALKHCVGTYAKDHANGKTAIFFVRRAKEPKKSYYTLELDEGKLTVRQNRGRRNCARTKEVEEFEAVWLAWIRAGAPRDAKGRPVVPESKQKEVTAA